LINIKKTRILITFLLSAGIFFAGSLSVIAVGDIMMGSDYPSKNLPSNQGRDLFTKIDSTLMGADLTLGNLEGTLLTGGVCTKKIQKGRCYAFRTPPGWAENLLNAGFDFMNLANNHMNDFGAGGIKATKKALSDVGLTYGGAYSEVGQFEINGNKVAIVSFSTSPNTNSIFEIPKAQRIVAEQAKLNDIIIVSFHAGGEGLKFLHTQDTFEYFMGWPRGNVVKFSRAVVDSGADFVWGHGPHVPRAMEIYNDRLIAYAIQRTYKYLALDSLHRAAKLVKELSAQDFPESTPIISDQGMIYPRTKK
jgi:poly-gamma-glutamate capsule biosynthesis protein CapA/YwtB (metallophosphatase superfamily)